MLNKILITTILLITLCPVQSFCSTYYTCDTGSTCGSGWSTGSDAGSCTSKGSPCKTIRGGIGKMSGGDTLIIGDGTYATSSNTMDEAGGPTTIIPSGSLGAYTTIKAENDFGVIIDGGGSRTPLHLGVRSYIRFEGLLGVNANNPNSSGSFQLQGSDHIKVLRCGSRDAANHHFAVFEGNYNLFEDCFAWGYGSYSFMTYSGGVSTNCRYNVFRRCLARRDGHYSQFNHWAGFNSYRSDNTHFQNCISIDGQYVYVSGTPTQALSKVSFYGANGPTNTTYDGCITLNDHGFVAMIEAGGAAFTDLFGRCNQNSGGSGYAAYVPGGIFSYGSSTLNRCVVSGNKTSSGDGQHSFWDIYTNSTITNSIIYNAYYGLSTVATHTYNWFYDLAGAAFLYCSGPNAGEITNTNPLTNGLLYTVRVEDASTLKTAGSSGGQLGPNIIYRIGDPETIYGDTNWNSVTSTALWPFPNEATIKTLMATYNSNGISGARGFATGTSLDGSAQTLTKYIWEYLGNQIPADIYGTDATASTTFIGTMSGCSLH